MTDIVKQLREIAGSEVLIAPAANPYMVKTLNDAARRIEELEALLKRIYLADRSRNNGLVMGEAVLCRHFSAAIKYLLDDDDE